MRQRHYFNYLLFGLDHVVEVRLGLVRLCMFGEDTFELRIAWRTSDLSGEYFTIALFHHRELLGSSVLFSWA